MRTKPRIFIGSTNEAYKNGILHKLSDVLNEWAEPIIWKKEFRESETAIESLERAFPSYDAFVFVVTADDILTTRDKEYGAIRDNILFEIGLANGLKGRKNVSLILNIKSDSTLLIKIPSDLYGITYFECTNDDDDVVENISTRIMKNYVINNGDPVEALVKEKFDEKVRDLTDEIKTPINEIRKSIGSIGQILENELTVFSGAQKAGIVNIFPNRYDKIAEGSLTDYITKEFITTKSTICILGISLGDYFLDRGMMHKKFLKLIASESDFGESESTPLHVKALIVDPKGKELIERAYWEAGPEFCENAEAYSDSTTYIETDGAARIARRLQNKYSTIEVRYYSQAPTCFLLLTDNYAFVENYTYASRGSSCPNIQIDANIKDGKNDLYKLYKKHFDNIWNTATPIDGYDSMEKMDDAHFKEYRDRNAKITSNKKHNTGTP